jgi:hypothetical protein
MLPELQLHSATDRILDAEYSSADNLLRFDGVVELLRRRHLMVEENLELEGEFLR